MCAYFVVFCEGIKKEIQGESLWSKADLLSAWYYRKICADCGNQTNHLAVEFCSIASYYVNKKKENKEISSNI